MRWRRAVTLLQMGCLVSRHRRDGFSYGLAPRPCVVGVPYPCLPGSIAWTVWEAVPEPILDVDPLDVSLSRALNRLTKFLDQAKDIRVDRLIVDGLELPYVHHLDPTIVGLNFHHYSSHSYASIAPAHTPSDRVKLAAMFERYGFASRYGVGWTYKQREPTAPCHTPPLPVNKIRPVARNSNHGRTFSGAATSKRASSGTLRAVLKAPGCAQRVSVSRWSAHR